MDTNTIATYKIFQGLDEKTLQKIAEFSSEKTVNANESILSEGHEADECYVIKNGKVNVLAEKWRGYDSDEGTEFVPVQTLSNGDALGWSWLIPPYKWGFNVNAVTDVELIVVDGAKLRDYAKENPLAELELYKRFFQIVKSRLLATRMNLALYAGEPFTQVEGG